MGKPTLPAADVLRAADPLNAEWVTVVLLLVVLLMALIQVGSPRKWRLLGSSMFSMRLGKQALREEMDLQDRAFLGLLAIGTTLLALFGWQVMELQRAGSSFPTLVGVLVAVVLGHYVLLRVLGNMLRIDHGMQEYVYTGFLLFILAGLLVLPLVVFIAYQPTSRSWAVAGGGLLLGLLLLYRWLRGVWIGLGEGVPLRYIILYFCAAELIPVLLVIDHWRNTSSPLSNS
ncbi:MAG TPA: DUF4271 domain-containing protein [Flavobacteriales bacterium]|nr:DUF4271 domain-containing protein [Flavobacteriales bacterium]